VIATAALGRNRFLLIARAQFPGVA
jgi:hypothetical protein